MTLPDLIGPQTRLLFVGVNPGLSSVAVQAPFSSPSNRFFPALFRAGLTDRLIDTSSGFRPGDPEHLIERGIGITVLVNAATARANELSRAQLTAGVDSLLRTVEHYRPTVVAMLGVTAYRVAFDAPDAVVGQQPRSLGATQLWVVPNPSGLNRRASLADLAAAYRQVGLAAHLTISSPAPGGTDA